MYTFCMYVYKLTHTRMHVHIHTHILGVTNTCMCVHVTHIGCDPYMYVCALDTYWVWPIHVCMCTWRIHTYTQHAYKYAHTPTHTPTPAQSDSSIHSTYMYDMMYVYFVRMYRQTDRQTDRKTYCIFDNTSFKHTQSSMSPLTHTAAAPTEVSGGPGMCLRLWWCYIYVRWCDICVPFGACCGSHWSKRRTRYASGNSLTTYYYHMWYCKELVNHQYFLLSFVIMK